MFALLVSMNSDEINMTISYTYFEDGLNMPGIF